MFKRFQKQGKKALSSSLGLERELEKEMRNLTKWLLVLLFFSVSLVFVQFNASQFQASVLTTKQAKPFDGTVYPIEKVPNWVKLTTTEWKSSYSDIPAEKMISMPKYDATHLQTPIADLKWGNVADDKIRTEKILYSVAYMGSYELNGVEYAGSHPAVDIKIPSNTPIHVIANGVVVKASLQTTGFGKHVVVKHENVPSITNPNQKVTLYSSYSHMNDVTVSEGDVLQKGQVVGYSGQTGTATTPHLHFQIDQESAPFHPYWPFTYSDQVAAGLDFFSAINTGLGKENGIANTVSPVLYVQKYFTYSGSSNTGTQTSTPMTPPATTTQTTDTQTTTSTDTAATPSTPSTTTDNTVPTQTTTVPVVEIPPAPVVPSSFTVEPLKDSFSRTETPYFAITALDDKGKALTNFEGQVYLTVSNGMGNVVPDMITGVDFSSGQATVSLTRSIVGSGQLSATYEGHTFMSKVFNILVEAGSVKKFIILHDGNFLVDVPETITIKAVDDQNRPVIGFATAGTVSIEIAKGSASLTTQSIDVSTFVNGETSFQIKPKSKQDIMIRVWYNWVNGESDLLRYALFDDVLKDSPHYNAIRYLKKIDVVSGYPDGTYHPKDTVTRVEALKIIYSALNKVSPDDKIKLPFNDVMANQWYAKYVFAALKEKVVQGYADGSFRPTQTVNRAEFIKMLSLAMGEDINPAVESKPYKDVSIDAWYAPYVQFAKDKNLVAGTSGSFVPDGGMTREEVAEMVFRVIILKEKVAESFSDGLVAGLEF